MIIEVKSTNMAILECFSSETRVKIIELLNLRSMNIRELAEALGISSAIVTKHIQKLESAGILSSQNIAASRGVQKICSLKQDTMTLQLRTQPQTVSTHYAVQIPIGQYSKCQVKPTCGLVSEHKIIGMVDDPRYFADPEHVKAQHLWFGSGYVEYTIPNYLHRNQSITSLEILIEICSEAPSFNESWPSDIDFYVNDIWVGLWTCPGDYGVNRGMYTPEWWNLGTQHGLLKNITIDSTGSWIDGIQLSDTNIKDLNVVHGEDIQIRIASLETAVNCGGVSLFGRNFGNYNQDINIKVSYNNV